MKRISCPEPRVRPQQDDMFISVYIIGPGGGGGSGRRGQTNTVRTAGGSGAGGGAALSPLTAGDGSDTSEG